MEYIFRDSSVISKMKMVREIFSNHKILTPCGSQSIKKVNHQSLHLMLESVIRKKSTFSQLQVAVKAYFIEEGHYYTW
jgi:hypothetical protein